MTEKSIWIDKLGICLSLCCGVKCLVTTIILGLGTFDIFNFILNEQVELAISASLLLIGITAMLPQFIIHHNYGFMGLFIGGFVLLKISENITMLWVQLVLLFLGVLVIIGAHYLNLKSKRKHAEYIKAVKKATGYSS
ncbi:MerC domain-containing protein [Fulvivirga lutea]|uniref:MerC domain-containing protein n=1 Tax=Fulvivirga lutea TaxID=2810512 RepID=A0A974WI84_9BACT|nr:MerC domain-containing protein [Fulvivirga lutea]QSE98911.1 MerC domain-containing protein [Fulvivirga lutea]